jgi:hypothetical protein
MISAANSLAPENRFGPARATGRVLLAKFALDNPFDRVTVPLVL